MTTACIIDMETGAVELRQFASTAEARRTFAREAEQLLVWEHQETRWTTTLKGREYQVDMDHIETEEMGNPSKVGQGYTQGKAAAAYLPHLRERCRTNTHERRTVLALARRYHAGEKLALAWWCSPKPCHCEAIQAAVVGFAGRM